MHFLWDKKLTISWKRGTLCNLDLNSLRRLEHLFWQGRLRVGLWNIDKLVITHAYSNCDNKSNDADAACMIYHTSSLKIIIFTYKACLLESFFVLVVDVIYWSRLSRNC